MAKTKALFRDSTEARWAYRRARAPMVGELAGDWKIDFLGPGKWLDLLPKAQRVLGISNLFGMHFEGAVAWHLVGKKASRVTPVKPLTIADGTSLFDGERTARLTSIEENGRLWEQFSSEVRVHDETTLVGVDLIGWEQWVVPMPFVLTRVED